MMGRLSGDDQATDNSDGLMKRILLAEDDNDMRRFLVKALEKAGYHVTPFDNGASAYDRLREEPFSLLLTDIVMLGAPNRSPMMKSGRRPLSGNRIPVGMEWQSTRTP